MSRPATVTPAGYPPGSVAEVLASDALTAVFQPVVDLATASVVGYEALARGPAGTRWESPSALLAGAAAEGRVADLDWACRAAEYRAALAADLPDDVALFVNTEPASVGVPCPPHLEEVVRAATGRLLVIHEITERAVADDPAGLLLAVEQARAASVGIALDDVGAEPASLAIMPFLDPDVVKLDLRLVQERTTPEAAAIVVAVLAHAERTGARVLAEGIEQARHVDAARTLGASLGQGYRYGRPGPLPRRPGRPPPGAALRFRSGRGLAAQATPFSVVAGSRATVRTTKELLLPLSMHLEHGALGVPPGVLLGCFQDARHFTPATLRRYRQYAERMTLTGALGAGMPAVPAAGVRGGRLAAGDPLRGEWDVLVVGPQSASALVARDLGDDGPQSQRRFDAVITHDRELVVRAASTLLARLLAPRPDAPPEPVPPGSAPGRPAG